MMALVLGVMAASILAGSMHLVFGSQSTNTAVAPAIQMASAVAKKVLALVMHFVAGADAQGHQRQPDGVGAVADADGVLGAAVGGELAFEPFEHRAHDKLAALDDFLDVGVNFGLDVVVLPNVTVKFDFHDTILCPTGDN